MTVQNGVLFLGTVWYLQTTIYTTLSTQVTCRCAVRCQVSLEYNGSFTSPETDRLPDWKLIPNLKTTLYYAEHVHIVQTRTRIPTPYFCTGQESETESISGNVNEPYS